MWPFNCKQCERIQNKYNETNNELLVLSEKWKLALREIEKFGIENAALKKDRFELTKCNGELKQQLLEKRKKSVSKEKLIEPVVIKFVE
jgi:hypothetical protein